MAEFRGSRPEECDMQFKHYYKPRSLHPTLMLQIYLNDHLIRTFNCYTIAGELSKKLSYPENEPSIESSGIKGYQQLW